MGLQSPRGAPRRCPAQVKRLAKQDTAEVRVENLDTAEQVEGHDRALAGDVVLHCDAHRNVVVRTDGSSHTKAGVRESQRAANEGDRIAVEREVDRALRAGER